MDRNRGVCMVNQRTKKSPNGEGGRNDPSLALRARKGLRLACYGLDAENLSGHVPVDHGLVGFVEVVFAELADLDPADFVEFDRLGLS